MNLTYLKLIDGFASAYPLSQLRADNPQISFPSEIPNDILSQYSVYPYYIGEVLNYNPDIEVLLEGGFEKDLNDLWHKPYLVKRLSLEDASNNIRTRRNSLLSDSDWLVTKYMEIANTIPEVWSVYRQGLRDITSQTGFPYDIYWPIKPE